MRIVGTIEARMGSSRLPGKTLMEIHRGQHLLEAVIKRFRLCKYIDDVYVATTTQKTDDAIARWCEDNQIHNFRGSENDVLDRVAKTIKIANADAIVQMGADSAYLDFHIVDELISYFNIGEYDYVCNDLELTYPLGIYGHVVKASVLLKLNTSPTLSSQDRDDVVRYIWEHQDKYNILNIRAPKELHYPHLRLTIDYPEDLEMAKAIYEHFDSFNFSTRDILVLYKQNPALFAETQHLIQQSAPFHCKENAYRTITGDVR
jgi:spore coat polysaccharide biosynthesis protein SpsF